jgi:hypothetical protein
MFCFICLVGLNCFYMNWVIVKKKPRHHLLMMASITAHVAMTLAAVVKAPQRE